MEPMDKEVLEQVRKVFMRYGIKSVTMDDISRELKISKKTLYKYVSDKPDLVQKVLEYDLHEDQLIMEKIAAESTNAIDELVVLTMHLGKRIGDIHPSIHYDLEKYYPEAWDVFRKFKEVTIFKSVIANLKRGIAEGVYRNDLNPEVVARLHISRIDIVFDGELFPPSQFHFGQVYSELMKYHIHGLASEKGVTYYNEKLKNENIKL